MNLSYNISGNLKTYLDKIEKLRNEILLTPLPPKIEVRLKWDSTLEKIYWSLSLINNEVSKTDVVQALSHIPQVSVKRPGSIEKDVINQRRALTYIKENWQASTSPVSLTTIKKLYDVSCRETIGKMSGLTEYSEKRINTVLDYLLKGQDHPVIQAGIAQIEIINITPFDNGNARVARLLSYLYLYKGGYDVRDLASFEEPMRRDMITLKRVLDLTKVEGNLTLWLEYFAFCLATSLEKAADLIKNQKFQEAVPASFWKITSRQRQILEYLENPALTITNKEVQKIHSISQITASRDLAKLTSLGLLLAHGKGRSVYYTRA